MGTSVPPMPALAPCLQSCRPRRRLLDEPADELKRDAELWANKCSLPLVCVRQSALCRGRDFSARYSDYIHGTLDPEASTV